MESDFQKKKAPAKHVIAIVAGKGGVGKSATTVNLALAMQREGYFVGILDADLYGPSLQKMLPEEEPPRECKERQGVILPASGKEIKMMSISYFRQGDATIVRAPIANSLISQFVHQVDWGNLDYLFFDFPPGTGDIQLTVMQEVAFSGAIVVTTPQEVALLDVDKAIQMLEKMQVPILGVIENMSYFVDPNTQEKHFVFGKGGGRKLAREKGLPFLGEIPIDPVLSSCLDQGKSIFENAGESISVSCFKEVAKQMQEHITALQEEGRNALTHFELVWK